MLDFGLDSNGDLRFSVSDLLAEKINARHAHALELLRGIEASGAVRLAAEAELMARHPASHALLSFRDNEMSPEQAAQAIRLLSSLDADRVRRLREGRVAVLQHPAMLPPADGGAALLRIDTSASSESGSLDELVDDVSASAGSAWDLFMRPVNTVTLVCVPGMPDLPYFSGSTSGIWGAIHMSAPSSAGILGESFTHEAAHFWLHAIEEFGDLASQAWTDQTWVSPWRNDPRPVAGIIHGVYVFSAAACTLAKLTLVDQQRGTKPSADVVGQRAAILAAQVEDGAREILRSGRATPHGLKVIEAGMSRLPVVLEVLGTERVEAAREQVHRRREQKISAWESQGVAFAR
jgi:HEXXH motif-containing protein